MTLGAVAMVVMDDMREGSASSASDTQISVTAAPLSSNQNKGISMGDSLGRANEESEVSSARPPAAMGAAGSDRGPRDAPSPLDRQNGGGKRTSSARLTTGSEKVMSEAQKKARRASLHAALAVSQASVAFEGRKRRKKKKKGMSSPVHREDARFGGESGMRDMDMSAGTRGGTSIRAHRDGSVDEDDSILDGDRTCTRGGRTESYYGGDGSGLDRTKERQRSELGMNTRSGGDMFSVSVNPELEGTFGSSESQGNLNLRQRTQHMKLYDEAVPSKISASAPPIEPRRVTSVPDADDPDLNGLALADVMASIDGLSIGRTALKTNPALLRQVHDKLEQMFERPHHLDVLTPHETKAVGILRDLQYRLRAIQGLKALAIMLADYDLGKREALMLEERRRLLTGSTLLHDEEGPVALSSTRPMEDVKLRAVSKSAPRFFWLNVLQSVPVLDMMVGNADVHPLRSLADIRVVRIPEDEEKWTMLREAVTAGLASASSEELCDAIGTLRLPWTFGFRVDFVFDQNAYFRNAVLSKTYLFEWSPLETPDPVFSRVIGSEILWYTHRNLTVSRKKRRQGRRDVKDRRRTRVRDVVVEEPRPSFFSFFSPPPLMEGDGLDKLSAPEAEELESLLEADLDIGILLRDKVVPNAISYYMGEIADEDVIIDRVDPSKYTQTANDEPSAQWNSALTVTGGGDGDEQSCATQ